MSQSLEKMISEANALMESVFRDLAINPPALARSNRRRENKNKTAKTKGQLQIGNSVNNNLNMYKKEMPIAVENGAASEEVELVELPNSPERSIHLSPARPAHSNVVIDLCFDSPNNDDVILVPSSPDEPNNAASCLRGRRPPFKISRRASENFNSREGSRTTNVAAGRTLCPSAAQNASVSAAGGLECPICMESCSIRQPCTTKCGHIFCKQCIVQSIRLTRKCPICKSKLNENGLIRIYI